MDKILTSLFGAKAIPAYIFVALMGLYIIGKPLAIYISKKYNPAKKVICVSKLSAVHSNYISRCMMWILYSFAFYIVSGIVIMAVTTKLELPLTEHFLMIWIAFSACLFALLQIFLSKKSKLLLDDMRQNINKYKIFTSAMFSLPKLTFVIVLAFTPFMHPNPYTWTIYVILFGALAVSLIYFSAIKFYDRYVSVKLVFKNSTPDLECNYDSFSLDDGFVLVANNDKVIAYNHNDISRIEKLYNNVDEQYKGHLEKRGFKK